MRTLFLKFTPAPVKVQPEKCQASSWASGRRRHAGWKYSALGELLPSALSVGTGILEVCICPNTSFRGQQYLCAPKNRVTEAAAARDTYHSSPGHTWDGPWLSLTQACVELQVWPRPSDARDTAFPAESRLAHTATCTFTGLRSTSRHGYKWAIPSCLLGQNSHWMQWVSVCLYSWGLNPQTFCSAHLHISKSSNKKNLPNTWLHLDSESMCVLTLLKEGLRLSPSFLNKSF